MIHIISPKKIIFGDEIEFDGYKHLDFYMDFGHMYFSFRKKEVLNEPLFV